MQLEISEVIKGGLLFIPSLKSSLTFALSLPRLKDLRKVLLVHGLPPNAAPMIPPLFIFPLLLFLLLLLLILFLNSPADCELGGGHVVEEGVVDALSLRPREQFHGGAVSEAKEAKTGIPSRLFPLFRKALLHPPLAVPFS